jgi:hypothetical protein
MGNTDPETYVVYLYSVAQQVISESELPERFDGLGLQAVCSSCGGFVGTIVQDCGPDAIPSQRRAMFEMSAHCVTQTMPRSHIRQH